MQGLLLTTVQLFHCYPHGDSNTSIPSLLHHIPPMVGPPQGCRRTNKTSPPVSGIGFRTDGLPFVTWITIAMGQLGWTQPEPKGLQIGGFWPTDPDPDAGLGVKGGDRQTAPVT